MKKPNIKFDPKAILGFLKARWSLLASVLALLAAPATALYFAGGMSRQVIADVQGRVDADLGEIGAKGSSAKVAYSLPPASPGGQAVEVSFAPNEALISKFEQLHKQQAAELSQIVQKVETFNRERVALEGTQIRREERRPIMDGFFPEPKENERLARSEFQRKLAPAHAALLTRYRAGSPPPPEEVATKLGEFSLQRIQALAGPGATQASDLNPDDQNRLQQELIAFRVARYQDRARQLLFYADMAMFNLPPEDPSEPPSLDQCWEWQHQYWVREDVLAAAAVANLPAANDGIPRAAVKRIESIAIDEFLWSESGDGTNGFNGIPLDRRVSITGRVGSTANTLFEVRPVTIVAVLSGSQVARFVDALATTNFMTVLDIDTVSIDPLADLANGFYYGEEHLVRATIKLETIWLRSWLVPTMPLSTKRAFGLTEPDPNVDPETSGHNRRRTGGGGFGGGGAGSGGTSGG